jgi:biopolymer transport protein ExbD
MNLRNRHKEAAEVHTGPLNDILFILLLFFLIASTVANPDVIKVNTPKAKADSKVKQSINVSIDAKNQFYLGTQPIISDSLAGAIRAEILRRPRVDTTYVVINVDSSATYGLAFRAAAIARALGCKPSFNVKDRESIK